eukprot:COSAG05_NODE_981_length_6302_cov_4.797034_5_plen_160_part_00
MATLSSVANTLANVTGLVVPYIGVTLLARSVRLPCDHVHKAAVQLFVIRCMRGRMSHLLRVAITSQVQILDATATDLCEPQGWNWTFTVGNDERRRRKGAAAATGGQDKAGVIANVRNILDFLSSIGNFYFYRGEKQAIVLACVFICVHVQCVCRFRYQ